MKLNYTGNIPKTTAPGSRPPLTGDAVRMASASGPLHIDGVNFKDGAGHIVQLQGVVLSHAQKTCNCVDNPFNLGNPGVWSLPGFFDAIAAWNINCVKFQINPRLWINQCPRGAGQLTSPQYRTMVQNAITAAQASGLYVIITNLDYYLPGGGNWPAPDSNTITFWTGDGASVPGIASIYASDQTVLFETFSEPHAITNDQWLNGGIVTWTAPNGSPGPTFTAIGVQAEMNAIWSVAPNSIILVDHKDFDTTPGGENPAYVPTGTNWGWSVHVYDSNNNAPPYKWPVNWANLATTRPMVATEFGDFNVGTGTWLAQNFLPYIATRFAGWTAFTYDNDPRDFIRPSLLNNRSAFPGVYETGDCSDYGQPIQAWYLGNFVRR